MVANLRRLISLSPQRSALILEIPLQSHLQYNMAIKQYENLVIVLLYN